MRAVLSIAGSDTSGGAGIQADIKTISAHGLFAETALTALTAQNTVGVHGVMEVPPEFIAQQIDAAFDDIRPAAVKVGMVPSADAACAIAESLARHGAENIVVDPVLVATSGAALSCDSAARAVVEQLFPLATVITPNMPEACALTSCACESDADMERAAAALAKRTKGAVLVKGGHGSGPLARDYLLPSGERGIWLHAKRVDNPNTHGTGCTLSSAIACGLANGLDVPEAVRQAKAYLTCILQAGLNLGRGAGPLDHFALSEKLQ